jgi:ParB family chromosome partitioning protein
LSGALHRDLDAFRQQALQAALVAKPKIAADLLAFTVCSQFVEALPTWETRAVSVSCEQTHYAEGKGFEDTLAAGVLKEADDKRSLEWASKDTPSKRYRAFCALTPKVKSMLVAYATAQSLTAGRATDPDAVTTALAEQLDVDVAAYWRPTADNYFKRLKGCDALLDIGREWFGDVWVQKHRDDKKSVLVSRLHEAVNNNATRDALDVDVLTRIDAWLPEEIRD